MEQFKPDPMDLKKLRKMFDTSTANCCKPFHPEDHLVEEGVMVNVAGIGPVVPSACKKCLKPFIQRVMDGSWIEADKCPMRFLEAFAVFIHNANSKPVYAKPWIADKLMVPIILKASREKK